MAIILTGVISPFLLAVGSAAFFMLAEHSIKNSGGVIAFVGVVWFFGSIVATVCAVLLGLFVEWPKLKWLTKLKQAGAKRSLFVSIVAAEILLLSALTISTALQPSSQFSNGADKGALFVVIAAAIGGACSAAFWWKLILVPMRRTREIYK